MAVTAGTRLGPYEILALLGAGGMGEVYQARDTRLDRVVAIKVLHTHLADDADRRARFEREARIISQLNHSHICTLYDVGHQDGIDYLVMELLDGQPLSERLSTGALPLDLALDYAIQIADALDAAHRHGIVHRDVKPANVMLTKSGAKLLDFGIARMTTATPSGTGRPVAPTLTVDGTLLGTPHYMAPEQLEGREPDARSDVFAFGVVLYEMLTGMRPFDGESQSTVIAAVLERQPPSLALAQPQTPPALDHLVTTSLAKSPDARWQTMHDVRVQLTWIASGAATAQGDARHRQARGRALWLGAAGVVIGAAIAGLVLLQPFSRARESPSTADVTRAIVDVSPAESLDIGRPRPSRQGFAFSADGRQLAFSGQKNGRLEIYMRPLDRLEAVSIPGTDDGISPFVSPDGKWLGFYAKGELKKVMLTGGPALTICKSQPPFGVSWGSDGRIVFGKPYGGLLQVSADGGVPEELTAVDTSRGEVSHRLPSVLPDGDGVLFTVTRNRFPRWDATEIFVYSKRARTRKLLVSGGADARLAASGHLLFVREGVLMATSFDLSRRLLTSGPVALVDDVMQAAYEMASLADIGAAQFAVSNSGALAYVRGGAVPEPGRTLVWIDRTGRAEPLRLPARAFLHARLSPDGKHVALGMQGKNMDIWVSDVTRGDLVRVTTEGRNGSPLWSADGTHLVFRGSTTGTDGLFQVPADGSGAPQRLVASIPNAHYVPAFWLPASDGLALYRVSSGQRAERSSLWATTLKADARPEPLPATEFMNAGSDLSPDARWLAYASDESGESEVYVRPYRGQGARQKVSLDGGTVPVWRHDGRELFYVRGRTQGSVRMQMMAAPVSPRGDVGPPRVLFEGTYLHVLPFRSFDVTSDGRRFLMIQEKERPSAAVTEMVLVQRWSEELKQRLP